MTMMISTDNSWLHRLVSTFEKWAKSEHFQWFSTLFYHLPLVSCVRERYALKWENTMSMFSNLLKFRSIQHISWHCTYVTVSYHQYFCWRMWKLYKIKFWSIKYRHMEWHNNFYWATHVPNLSEMITESKK